jgi:hypothetical protein
MEPKRIRAYDPLLTVWIIRRTCRLRPAIVTEARATGAPRPAP